MFSGVKFFNLLRILSDVKFVYPLRIFSNVRFFYLLRILLGDCFYPFPKDKGRITLFLLLPKDRFGHEINSTLLVTKSVNHFWSHNQFTTFGDTQSIHNFWSHTINSEKKREFSDNREFSLGKNDVKKVQLNSTETNGQIFSVRQTWRGTNICLPKFTEKMTSSQTCKTQRNTAANLLRETIVVRQ